LRTGGLTGASLFGSGRALPCADLLSELRRELIAPEGDVDGLSANHLSFFARANRKSRRSPKRNPAQKAYPALRRKSETVEPGRPAKGAGLEGKLDGRRGY